MRAVHRGSVEVSALGITLKRRVLCVWQPGASVYAVESGWLVVFATPRRAAVDTLLGAPFVAIDGVLSSAPLSRDELRATGASRGDAVWVIGGRARVIPLAGQPPVDLADWLKLDFEVADVSPLGATPPSRAIAVAAPKPARAVFAERVQELPAEAAQVMDAIRSPASTRARASIRSLASLREWLILALGWLGSIFSRRAPGAERSGSLATRVWNWLARVLFVTRLARFLGARQAEYLRRLLEMFERQDYERALRHAIPLGGDSTGPTPPALGLPAARSELAIRPARTRASSTLGFGPDLFDHMRRLYRNAFERLDAAGRHDLAAFVLAELLGESEEAVAYLERHGELELAAEVAEARKLPPGLVVRQWFVAGRTDRAVLVARRTGAFADAVLRLEHQTNGAAQARALRLHWADHLASTGNFAQAVEVAASIDEAEPLVEAWTDRALALGGSVRARMLTRIAARHPDRLANLASDLEQLLESPDTLDERVAIAETLMAVSPPGRPESLAASVTRALLADASTRSDASYATLAVELVRRTNLRVERADLPPMPVSSERRFATHGPELALTLHPGDTGALEVWDAAVLASGRLVLALGEAGIRIQTAAGKRIAHLDVPAHRIVPSDHGDRLLALAKRGKAWRVSRVDLIGRRGEPWTELRLEAFAPTFDGDSWAVAMGGDLLALDVLSHDVTALHSVPRLNLPVACIARSRDAMSVILGEADHREWWRFELPAWTLRSRSDPFGDHDATIFTTAEAEICASLALDATLTLHRADFATPIDLPPSDVPESPHALCLSRAWLAATLTSPAATRVLLVNPATQLLRASVTLSAVRRTQTRISGGHLLIADDLGRLTTIDLTTGSARTQRVGVGVRSSRNSQR